MKNKSPLSPLRLLFSRISAKEWERLTAEQRQTLQYQALMLCLFGCCAALVFVVGTLPPLGDQAFALGQSVRAAFLQR